MKIGEVARAVGIGTDALRYYERRGIIAKPARTGAGYRNYSPDVLLRLRFVIRAKELGFSLREISELLAIDRKNMVGAAEVKSISQQRLKDIESKIRSLQGMREALQQMLLRCPGQGPTGDCSIVSSLTEEDKA